MFIGLDIGTSVIKGALFTPDGRERADTAERTALRSAPIGWSEIDGEAVWWAAARALRRLVAAAEGTPIRGVAVTGVMVGAWLVDAAGALVRPPILWNDARAQALVDRRVAARPSFVADVFARSGSVMQLGCTLPVLAWLAQEEPHHLAAARHVLCAKDFVRFRLTGEIATDESEAAMAPGSALHRDFDPAQAELLGVGAFTRLLAPVRRGETLAGTVTGAAAAATGLPAGTPVAVGTGDASACILGAGCHRAGQATSILGTTCLNGVVFEAATFTPPDLGLLFIVPGGLFMKTMVNVAGTTVIDWTLSSLCPDVAAGPRPYDALADIAAAAAPGAGGVAFVPYLSASGVIAPRIEPRARAAFAGLAPHHGRSDLVRAVYEGIAYAIRACFRDVGGAHTIRLSGGGARSPFWSQMIADVCGVPVEVPEGTQLGAKGAMLCAATAVGDYASVREASAATFRLHRRHEPDAATAAAYAAGFARFEAASGAALGPLTALAASAGAGR